MLYRVFTLIQMGGVLVLAAGVPAAFSVQDFGAITLGYLIMRLGLLAMLVRAAIEDPESRPNSSRYIVGISLVQVGWLLRLFFVPADFLVLAFLVLVVLELLVSPWADRAGRLAWHPHHIAERYGLFAIILLGESVLAVTIAVQDSLTDGVGAPLVIAATSGLVLLFSLWWLYFSEPSAEGLVNRRDRAYFWGYGHYGIYASLAAIGAGLEVVVKVVTHHSEASELAAGYALATPLAVFLLLLWVLHAPMVDNVSIPPVATLVAVLAVLAAPLAAPGIGVLGVTVLMTGITVVLLVVALVSARAPRGVGSRLES